MNLLKKTGAIAVALSLLSFSAQAKQLDILAPSGNTGNGWKMAVMWHKALVDQGYDSKLHWTKNCHKNNKWIKNNPDRQAMFLLPANSWKSNRAKQNCTPQPHVSYDNFVSVLYLRSMALCVSKSANFTNINDFMKSKKKIKIGVSDYPAGMFNDLSKQFNVPFQEVTFGGSSKTLKGLIAGDVDIIFTGYTAREINTPGVQCFATSKGVNGTKAFAELFPTWKLKNLANFSIMLGANIKSKENLADAKAALHKMLKEDSDLVNYYSKSFIITGADLEATGAALGDFWKTVDTWISLDN